MYWQVGAGRGFHNDEVRTMTRRQPATIPRAANAEGIDRIYGKHNVLAQSAIMELNDWDVLQARRFRLT